MRVKGVDNTSAYIMRVKSVHEKLSSEVQLILTLITLKHYNTFISRRMHHGLKFLMDKSPVLHMRLTRSI